MAVLKSGLDVAEELPPSAEASEPSPPRWLLAALIAMIAFQLRSVILAVSPVLPSLRSDLHLSFGAAGALTAIPVLGLGAAAVPGAILVSRFGARRVVGAATLGLGLCALLRVSPPLPYSLFFWTAMLALCIAMIQPSIPAVARSWFPARVQQASTVYSASLAVGGLVSSTASVYLLALGGWRFTFVLWAGIAILGALAWIALAPGRGTPHEPVPHGIGRLIRDRQVWLVAALFGTQSLMYYGTVTWLPFLLRGYGRDYLATALFLFQVTGPVLIAGLTLVRRPWARSRVWYVAGGLLMTCGSVALALELTGSAWLWATVIGLGGSMIFAGSMVLPAILAREPADVAGYTALVLTAGYALSFLGPLLGGVLVDLTHESGAPFALTATSAAVATCLGVLIPRRAGRERVAAGDH